METPWLEQLEERVRQAMAEISHLREERTRLAAELAACRERGFEAGGEAGAADWAAERDEVRRRVEGLVGRLEEILGE